MQFRRPFDSRQRKIAVQLYKQHRAYIQAIRREYPPANAFEFRTLSEYREHLKNFARELQNFDDKINPGLLNVLADRIDNAWSSYLMQRMVRRLES